MSKNREEWEQSVQSQQRVYGQGCVAAKAHLFDNIAYDIEYLSKDEGKYAMDCVSVRWTQELRQEIMRDGKVLYEEV